MLIIVNFVTLSLFHFKLNESNFFFILMLLKRFTGRKAFSAIKVEVLFCYFVYIYYDLSCCVQEHDMCTLEQFQLAVNFV